MKQVFKRALLLLLPVLLLVGGTGIFSIRYVTRGAQWAAFPANEHAYTDGRLSSGQLLDREGRLLYDAATDSYSDDESFRRATLHAVGDSDGNIATSARSALSDHMVGYNPITGTQNGGNKVYLTIDAELNETALNALGWRKGTVGLYNYQTGEVLCMVSTPTFDPLYPPEIYEGDDTYDGVYLNRLLSSSFTPGSIFKVVTAAAAIENIPDLMDRTFTCTGDTVVGDESISCPYAHGEMTFSEAFARSCNCAFAQLATEMGGKTMKKYTRTAGLLSHQSVSGIDTAAGSYDIDSDDGLGWSGAGQFHNMVNPSAMMTLMGSIATDGKAAQPHLIHRKASMHGIPLPGEFTETAKLGWEPETCQKLRDIMFQAVDETYGRDNFGGLPLCAKSGTAEVGDGEAPHAWFTGFLDDPAHPYAFVVLVENGGGGADVAGPIASRILQQAVDSDL